MERIQSLLRRRPGAVGEPSAGLFRRIRWRLTLQYSALLAAALVVVGIILYIAVRQALLGPVDDDLRSRGSGLLARGFPPHQCMVLPPNPEFQVYDQGGQLAACYGPQGELFAKSTIAYLVAPRFTESTLAVEALADGQAFDTIDGGNRFGELRRYALKVTDQSGAVLGVVLVGTSVDVQLHTLSVLLKLLWLLGLLALLAASVGGLFLANRALLPVRLAYSRQRDFIADASHELRTPLTMLRADAEVLLRDRRRLTEDDAAILEDMVAETSHMSALATSMLDLARLGANEAHLERDVVDLSVVAADVARRMSAVASERDVRIRAEPGPPVLVVGDRLLLEQAALVLADNAVKYNRPRGEVIVRAFAGGDEARLEVRDTGIGIAPEHLPRLGERFYRVDKARSREAGGAGLGLSIVHTIAARHGGSIGLASEPGQGTVATLTLPATRSTREGAAVS